MVVQLNKSIPLPQENKTEGSSLTGWNKNKETRSKNKLVWSGGTVLSSNSEASSASNNNTPPNFIKARQFAAILSSVKRVAMDADSSSSNHPAEGRGCSRDDPIVLFEEDGTAVADPSESVRRKYEMQTVAALQGRATNASDARVWNSMRSLDQHRVRPHHHPQPPPSSSTTSTSEGDAGKNGTQQTWLQRVGSNVFCKRTSPTEANTDGRDIRSSKSGETTLSSSSSLSRNYRPASAPPTHRQNTSSKHNHALADADVLVALQGLDEAERLSQRASSSSSPTSTQRRRKQALQMYQSHLGVLVNVLTGGAAARRNISYDTDVLGERVRAAMTEAEALKASLAAGGGGAGDSVPTVRRPAATTAANNTNVGGARRNVGTTTATTARTNTTGNGRSTSGSSGGAATVLDPRNDPLLLAVGTDMWTRPEQNTICWTDVAGLETAKRALQEAVILPLIRPDLYTGLRTAPKGILLYGPPGTGKTLLAKAAAHEGKCNFFACSPSTLTSKWMGEGEKLLKTLFRLAREASPSIVFFDEIDSLLSKRKTDEHEASRRFKTEFMVQVDGVVATTTQDEQHVLVLGCTNCPWDLDDAVLRRFQRRIYVPLPDANTRELLIKNMLEQNRHCLTKRQITQIVKSTNGCSCSDLKAIANEASFGPLRSLGSMERIRDADATRDVRPITAEDYAEAIRHAGKTVSASLLKKYDVWQEESGAR